MLACNTPPPKKPRKEVLTPRVIEKRKPAQWWGPKPSWAAKEGLQGQIHW